MSENADWSWPVHHSWHRPATAALHSKWCWLLACKVFPQTTNGWLCCNCMQASGGECLLWFWCTHMCVMRCCTAKFLTALQLTFDAHWELLMWSKHPRIERCHASFLVFEGVWNDCVWNSVSERSHTYIYVTFIHGKALPCACPQNTMQWAIQLQANAAYTSYSLQWSESLLQVPLISTNYIALFWGSAYDTLADAIKRSTSILRKV